MLKRRFQGIAQLRKRSGCGIEPQQRSDRDYRVAFDFDSKTLNCRSGFGCYRKLQIEADPTGSSLDW